MSHADLEEGTQLQLDWRKLAQVAATEQPLLPVVVQEAETGEVLILAYANEEALAETLRRRVAVFWSTSRDELWVKGATSGQTLALVEVRVNCEQNSLLYRVRVAPGQGACHTREADGSHRSGCYYRRLGPAAGTLEFI